MNAALLNEVHQIDALVDEVIQAEPDPEMRRHIIRNSLHGVGRQRFAMKLLDARLSAPAALRA